MAESTHAEPLKSAGLSVGEHTLQVRAFDGSGRRDESPEEIRWRVLPVDTVLVVAPAPSALPHSPLSFEVRSSSAKWAFEYRVDDGAWHLGSVYSLAGDRKPNPGSAYDRADVIKHTDHTRRERQMVASGLPDHHTLEVRAFNECGEVGPSMFASWKTTWVQTSVLRRPPTSPVNETGMDFVVEVGPTRPIFEYRYDDGEWRRPQARPQPSSGTSGVRVQIDNLSEGTHSLEVRAMDYHGRADFEPAVFQWEVDTTPPHTTVRPTSAPAQSPSEAAFQWSCDDLEQCSFRYSLDDGPWIDTDSSFVRMTGLSTGVHELVVAAVDAAGNQDPDPPKHRWEVNLLPPITTIVVGPNKFTHEQSAHFEFSTSREGCRMLFSLDGGDYEETPGHSLGLYDLEEGPHRLRVYSVDSFGHTEPSPAVYTWVVDTVPPRTVVHQWYISSSEPGAAAFSVGVEADSAAEGVFDYQYQVCSSGDCGSWQLGPKAARLGPGYELRLAGLTGGGYAVKVRASDRAGNTDPSPAIVEFDYVDTVGIVDSAGVMQNDSDAESIDLQVDPKAAGHNLNGIPSHPPDSGDSSSGGDSRGMLANLLAWFTTRNRAVGPQTDLRRKMRREL